VPKRRSAREWSKFAQYVVALIAIYGAALTNRGFDGVVALVGFYEDALGTIHKSEPLHFDIRAARDLAERGSRSLARAPVPSAREEAKAPQDGACTSGVPGACCRRGRLSVQLRSIAHARHPERS